MPEILLLFAVLEVTALVVNSLSRVSVLAEAGSPFWGLACGLFLVWRVSDGGWICHGFLVLGSGLACIEAILRLAVLWNPAVAGLMLIFAVQFVLLVSPPVIARVRRSPGPVLEHRPLPGGASRRAGVRTLARRPPNWLLVAGVFLGVLVALGCVASMSWVAIPGCEPASSAACITLARGYPVRWLTATQNVPLIDAYALFKDCVQWTLGSWAVLYACWLWVAPRPAVGSGVTLGLRQSVAQREECA